MFVCLFIYLFLNLAEAAASAASMQFTALGGYMQRTPDFVMEEQDIGEIMFPR